MGGHNRPYPSLRWVGMDDEQTFARDTRDWRERRDLKFEVQGSKFRKPRTSDLEPLCFSPVSLVGYPAGSGNVMRWSGGFDSSKRAGIRCLPGFNFYRVLSEGGMRRGWGCT